jgi:hypothetical protein
VNTSSDNSRLSVTPSPAQARVIRELADKAPPSNRRAIRPRS